MPAYHAINGDAERNDGRPSSANSSHRGSRYARQTITLYSNIANDQDRPRSARGRKEVGVIGQASWLSSIINLVNTSTDTKRWRVIPKLTSEQLLELVS